MRCENQFCIYHNNDSCVLDDIELDIAGQCQSCIYISLSEKELNKIKTKTIENIGE